MSVSSTERATELGVYPRSIDDWQTHLFRVYGLNNNAFIQPRTERIQWLNSAIRQLKVDLREDETPNQKQVRESFARIPPRIFAIGETLPIRVIHGIAEKFPANGCINCEKMPCECPDKPNKEGLRFGVFDPRSAQAQWGFQELQDYSQRVYGLKNGNNVSEAWSHLQEETGELMEIEHDIVPQFRFSAERIAQEYRHELADAMMRLVACANIVGVDLQAVSVERYGNGCHQCGGKVCRCQGISYKMLGT